MKYECKVVEDLLPLYKDDVCSDASKKVVEEHLAECPKCSDLLKSLKDNVIDELILRERDDVIGSQSRFFRRKSALAGIIIAAVFAIPILVCLIVNLASGQGLSWFFIVLCAMFIPTSLFVVPLVAPKNRMLLSMGSFTASLILLLAVINIYTGGDWFFIAASSVLFGLTVCFMPFIVCRRPVSTKLKKTKGLVVMSACTLSFYLMILCIGLYTDASTVIPMAVSISGPIIAMTWLVFLIIRYFPHNGLVKAGLCIIALTLFSYFGTEAIIYLVHRSIGSTSVMVWTEPSLLFMTICLAVGALFAAIGLLIGRKKGGNEK